MEILHNHLLCDVVNVCTGNSITIDELLDSIVRLIGEKPEVLHRELPAGDPERSSGTCEKMARLLGIILTGATGLEEGLKKTIEYYRQESL